MAAETSLGQRHNDVFLSFRGEDTRKNFTDNLYYALKRAGINVFRDNEGLQRGEQISTQLKQAIHCSRMSIVVFSINYASSRWCLEELVEIMECEKSAKQIVVPVFFKVEPWHVRHQKETFEEAFAEHQQRYTEQKVAEWRVALTTAGNLSGYHFNDGFEGKFIDKIVKEVSKQLNVHRSRELPLPTTEQEGEAFKRNKETIWFWLMDEQVSRIGIYGMGGVGKTTLMTHIQNQLLKEWRSSFRKNVYWVTVSQDFNIYKMQNLIAKTISLDLLDYEEEKERAAKLFKALTERGEFVFILDDLSDHFDEIRVGIPISNKYKLVITTRSLNVCRRMHCKEENLIKVQPLVEKEAWNLFAKELGSYSTEVEQYAKDVASECSGLPLGLLTMASSMRGVSDIREWKNVLEELQGAKVTQGEMDEKVFCVLKMSYLRLNDLALQKCFLYCALFPEDHAIVRDDLIELLIAEGIIEEKNSREAEFDNGHAMLNKLENVCLLEGCENDLKFRCIKMHDVIRDMAIKELRESSTMTALIEAGVQLRELLDIKIWNENLVIVSLVGNDLKKISFGHTNLSTLFLRENGGHIPRCSNLSTLLLAENKRLERISISFFQTFDMLKVVDFSGCRRIEKLPESISNLMKLSALFLRGCESLFRVPSLEKLTELKMLDLSGCKRVRNLPKGLKKLSKLKYLDLTNTLIEEIPKGLLPKISLLQVLKLQNDFSYSGGARVEGREVGRLRNLETLKCCFGHSSDFNEYMESREQQSLSKYWFQIGLFGGNYVIFGDGSCRYWDAGVGIFGCSIGEGHDSVALPLDIQQLYIERCDALKCLCEGISTLGASTQLHSIWVSNCRGLKSLISSSFVSNNPLKSLHHLKLHHLENLRGLIRTEDGTASTISNSFFFNLKSIYIWHCNSLKKLFPPGLIPNLQNLEKIKVMHCNELEEIFAMDEREAKSSAPTKFSSNLKSIEIEDCHSLKKLFPPSLLPNLQNIENITVESCSKMEKIFAADNGDDKEQEEGENISSSSSHPITSFLLPKLKELILKDLPELRSIYKGAVICDSLQEIRFINCLKLKRMPFPASQPCLQRITVYTKEWWESVEWGSSNAKKNLQSLVVYKKFCPLYL